MSRCPEKFITKFRGLVFVYKELYKNIRNIKDYPIISKTFGQKNCLNSR